MKPFIVVTKANRCVVAGWPAAVVLRIPAASDTDRVGVPVEGPWT
jgi:hypothetical protein